MSMTLCHLTSNPMKHLLFLFAALALGAVPGCGWLVGSWAGAPTLEERQDGIILSHAKHTAEGIGCEDCHKTIKASETIQGARELPKKATCIECHDGKEKQCGFCHKDEKKGGTYVDLRMDGIRFSHKNHIERKLPGTDKAGCEVCHASTMQSTKPSESHRPDMFVTCMQCHKRSFRREDCVLCHANLTESKQLPLSMFDHGGDWLNRHGTPAKGGQAVCAHCHKTSFCADCHTRAKVPLRAELLNLDRPDRRFRHRGDWISKHPIEARMDGKSCLTCHDKKSCGDCHDRMGIGHKGVAGTQKSPHPAGWLTRGSGAFHGTEARRDVLVCAACHDRGAASNCVTCHRVGGPGGNPHPATPKTDLDKNTSPACVPCHK